MCALKWKCTNECRSSVEDKLSCYFKTTWNLCVTLHKAIKTIGGMLSNGSFEELIHVEYLGLQEDLSKLFSEEGEKHA